MLDPHTGQPVYDYDPTTGKQVPRLAPEGSTSNIAYTQGANMVADSPATRRAAEQAKANAIKNSQGTTEWYDEDWQKYKKTHPTETYENFKATQVAPATGITTTPSVGSFAMGGKLPEDYGIELLEQKVARMSGGYLNTPGMHSYARGGYTQNLNFDIDPPKEGDTRVNAEGKTERFNGKYYNNEPVWEVISTVNPNTTAEDEAIDDVEGRAEYEGKLKKEDESLKDRNLNLKMDQSLPEFLASAAPAAYNLGQGIFGKVQQLNPQDYMIGADMQPYQYNINPQLREADQSFAQGQEAIRNAGLGGGSYAANMQQLANARNQTIGGLYAQKQNADAESYNQAMAQNKAIEAQNLERRMGIEDFNLKSEAAKTAMLQTGLQQLAQVSEGSQAKKLQVALMQALAPEFAGTMAYNTIADQYLNKLREKKKAKNTDKTKG
jgi:hypothetical protein